jgi:hypothetical protein
MNDLCSTISQAAIYGTTHFAAAVGKLIAEVSGVVKSQTAAVGSLHRFLVNLLYRPVFITRPMSYPVSQSNVFECDFVYSSIS